MTELLDRSTANADAIEATDSVVQEIGQGDSKTQISLQCQCLWLVMSVNMLLIQPYVRKESTELFVCVTNLFG